MIESALLLQMAAYSLYGYSGMLLDRALHAANAAVSLCGSRIMEE